MIAPDEEQRRSLWQRLRYVRIALAWSCSLLLLLALLIAAINLRDEALTPEALAWLQESPNPVAPADNAFLAIAALQVEQRADSGAGRRVLATIGEEPTLLLDEKRLSTFGTLWQPPEIARQLCSFRPGDPPILARIASKHVELKALLKQQRPALDRYYAAIALPGFHEVTVAPQMLFQQGSGPAACLARIDLAFRLLDGEKGAAEDMQHHIGYWTKAFVSSQILVSERIADVRLRTDIALLTDLHSLDFTGKRPLFEALRPSFQAVADAQIGTQIMAGELRFSSHVLEELASDRNNSWWEKLVLALFFKQHATLNQKQQLAIAILRNDKALEKQACPASGWHDLYNPLGKMSVCTSQPEQIKEYLRQIIQTQQDIRHFITTAH